ATLHRPEPGDRVLDRPGEDVMDAGATIRGGRALVEYEGLAIGGVLETSAEGVLRLPGGKNLFLEIPGAAGKIRIFHRALRRIIGMAVALRHGDARRRGPELST